MISPGVLVSFRLLWGCGDKAHGILLADSVGIAGCSGLTETKVDLDRRWLEGVRPGWERFEGVRSGWELVVGNRRVEVTAVRGVVR